jgi:signal transduction histidine kinase
LADAIMIEQVLLNLIKNAIEAMQASDRRARTLVITSGRGAEGMLQVSLRDSGHGIPAEVAANLYTPFFSTKQSGMGIGLNISRSIIELHGGKLWHESIDGGSVFHFTVPVASA